MISWRDVESELTSFTPEETLLLNTLTELISERQNQGLSIPTLAKRRHISATALTDLEQVAQIPTLHQLTDYAAGLGVTLDLSIHSKV